MATRLGLYNAALQELGVRKLADTGEAVKAGRVVAGHYDNVVGDCLSAGSWNFAMETIKTEYDTGVTPNFGYTKVFAKPSDWVRTIGVSEDEYFSVPLLHFYDDANFWSADNSPIYVRYVSDDTGLGLSLGRWPSSFRRFVELELASRSCLELTEDKVLRDEIRKDRDKAKSTALNHDAMNEANPKFAPPGSWTVSRGGRSSRGDRGSRSNLTG